MRSSFPQILTLGMLVLMGAAVPALSFAPSSESTALEFALPYDANVFLLPTARVPAEGFGRSVSGSWVTQTNQRTGNIHMAYGGDVFLAAGVSHRFFRSY